MEKFKFKNKPELKFNDSKVSSPESKKGGLWGITEGKCDIHTISEPTECEVIHKGLFGPEVWDYTITIGCIA